MTAKIVNAFRFVLISCILAIVAAGRTRTDERSLLVVRLDAIGDYLLFRNFLEVLRKSDRFRGYSITLCGNSIWKDLATTFDRDAVDGFIWVDTKRFYRNLRYLFTLLRTIRRAGFECVIEATYSRTILFGDVIVRASKAKERIGYRGSGEAHTAWKRKLLTDRYYTRLIDLSDPDVFEFNANRDFVSAIIGKEIPMKGPSLHLQRNRSQNDIPCIVLFPGTAERRRMWSPGHFRTVAEALANEYPYTIVLSGSKREEYLFHQIAGAPAEKYRNSFGNTLVELTHLIAGAVVVISNNTSAIHFAAAVGTPFVCISSGSYYGRFTPYPDDAGVRATYIYPPAMMASLDRPDELKVRYRFESDLDINEITPAAVVSAARQFIGDYERSRAPLSSASAHRVR